MRNRCKMLWYAFLTFFIIYTATTLFHSSVYALEGNSTLNIKLKPGMFWDIDLNKIFPEKEDEKSKEWQYEVIKIEEYMEEGGEKIRDVRPSIRVDTSEMSNGIVTIAALEKNGKIISGQQDGISIIHFTRKNDDNIIRKEMTVTVTVHYSNFLEDCGVSLSPGGEKFVEFEKYSRSKDVNKWQHKVTSGQEFIIDKILDGEKNSVIKIGASKVHNQINSGKQAGESEIIFSARGKISGEIGQATLRVKIKKGGIWVPWKRGWHFVFGKGGIFMWPIASAAFVGSFSVLLIITQFWTIGECRSNGNRFNMRNFVDEVKSCLSPQTDRDYDGALRECERWGHPLAKMYRQGIEVFQKLSHTGSQHSNSCSDILRHEDRKFVERAMEKVGNGQIDRLERVLPMLIAIVSTAPMMGFLGTIYGLIKAFMGWEKATENVTVSVLAGGIHQAMITTAGGLIIAIPFYFVYVYFVAKIKRIAQQMSDCGDELLDMLFK